MKRWNDWSLRNKVAFAAGLVAVFTALALSWHSGRAVGQLALESMRARGADLGAAFAAQAEQLLMMGNTAGLKDPIKELKSHPEIAYLVVVDAQGKVTGHSFEGELPKELAAGLASEEHKKEHTQSGGSSYEIDLPLMGGGLGTVHLGLSEDYVSGVRRRHALSGLAMAVATLAIGIGLMFFFAKKLLEPVLALSEATRRIVEDGDLTTEVKASSGDEIGVLAARFATMVERLREIPRQLSRDAEMLAQAVQALQAATEAQNASVTRQATALQETQVTAEEIRQTSQVASRTAEGVLLDIAKAEAVGEKGSAALEMSLSGLQDILVSTRNTAASIADLGERTRQIGGITGTVKDLADQSNMLALNAAIEAVRSGEHGKGFSLVAREIRRLADQSIQSTERVREILEGVGRAVNEAVGGSEEGARRVEGSLQQMQASAESLSALANVVRENSAAVRQIATAVNQQNTGVNQVFAAVVDQNKMMEEAVANLQSTAKAVATVKEVAQSLNHELAKYKV